MSFIASKTKLRPINRFRTPLLPSLESCKILYWVLPFLIFINDLHDTILSKLAIYADDTTFYSFLGKTIDVRAKVEMAADLEDDLRTVVEWGKKWLVSFNASKAKLLSINRFRTPFLPSMLMNDSELTESTQIQLLGLTFTNNFSWILILNSLQNLLP